MKLLQVDTLEQARQKVETILSGFPRKIQVREILDAAGMVLAEDIYAPESIPSFRRSTVDGYAVLSDDTHGCTENIPVFLNIVEDVAMGQKATVTLQHGQCAYVPTGGMIPDGADAMVMVEYCEIFRDGQLAVNQSVAYGNCIVGIGDDVKEGSLLLKKGTFLRNQEIGSLASLGIERIKVYVPYAATLISMGDELVPIGEAVPEGKVRESNSYGLRTQLKSVGITLNEFVFLPDQEEMVRRQIQKAMAESDLVITSGGSSQGKKDMTERVFDELSDQGVCMHGLALKPGKPTILATDKGTSTLLIGLPGHPVAATIVFELMIASVVRKMQGQVISPIYPATIKCNMPSDPGKTTCVPVRLCFTEEACEAEPLFGRSGLWSTLTRADGYILIEQNREGLRKGETVQVHLFTL